MPASASDNGRIPEVPLTDDLAAGSPSTSGIPIAKSNDRNTASERFVGLGLVVGPHGLRGQLRVKLYNPDSKYLGAKRELLLCLGGEIRAVRVTAFSSTADGFGLMTIDGCQSRDSAQQWRGAELCVPRKSLPSLAEGEFYYADLEGLVAVLENGETVGVVQRVISYPAADVMAVKSDAGLREVPMREPYLIKVDIKSGVVVIAFIEDLDLQPLKKPPGAR